jgi:HD-like signal output (HDOD) protein
MRRILFVDDEQRILDGLRDLLRRRRNEWDMHFADGGQQAILLFEEKPFDVVVSDMRMPGMDGASLLRIVRDRWPDCVRLVLSGFAEEERARRVVSVAHQFLLKPCDAAQLQNVIERACDLRTLLADEGLRAVVGKTDSLPSLPRVYQLLTQVLEDPHSSVADVAGVVEQDMAMCAKIMQLVNSAFFAIPRRITSMQQAIVFLGSSMVRNLALSTETFRALEGVRLPPGYSLDALHDHALLTASLARQMLPEKKHAEDAFMAGMLHDVGHLILATRLPEHLAKALALATEQAISLHAAERQLSATTHAEMGAYLLGLWGLPYPIVEAVAYHHDPSRVEQRAFDVLSAVHVADRLAHEACPASSHGDPLDPAYVQALGVGERLDEWRKRAAELVAEPVGA